MATAVRGGARGARAAKAPAVPTLRARTTRLGPGPGPGLGLGLRKKGGGRAVSAGGGGGGSGRSATSQREPLPYVLDNGVEEGSWFWKETSCNVRFQKAGEAKAEGPVVLLIHGFGANADHFRKNIGRISEEYGCRVYAIDLIGYGYSDKPNPRASGRKPNDLYNFYVWAKQVNAFLDEVVHKEGTNRDTVLVCNSIGCLVGLQAIADKAGVDDDYKGIVLLNPSLRLLHKTKQSWIAKPFVKLFQDFLRETPAGEAFFAQVATAGFVEKVLKQAYHNPDAVSTELVQSVLRPGLEPGASAVFLDFVSYSDGPLPEELIPRMKCPVELIWGENDPWEPIEMGREQLGAFDTVRNFVSLPEVGHCPQDEAPDLVNPLIGNFVADVTSKTKM